MKCSAKSLPVLIQSGFSNDWSSAMPSAIAILTTLLPMGLVLDSALLKDVQQHALARAMHHCPILSKLGPWDYRELIETDSLFDVNIWATLANLKSAKRDLSSFSSTTRSTVLTLITFPFLFHVSSLRFFITAKRCLLLCLTLFYELNNFTLWNQIFPHLFAHSFLRDQILKVGT